MRISKQRRVDLLGSVWLFERCSRRELDLLQRAATHQARVIDLDEMTISVLIAYRAQREAQARTTGEELHQTDRVFVGANGAVLHPQTVTLKFHAAVREAALPRIRFHDLRHTHATLAIRAGVSPKVISERLGHHTPEFTMHQYAHVLPGMQAEATVLLRRY